MNDNQHEHDQAHHQGEGRGEGDGPDQAGKPVPEEPVQQHEHFQAGEPPSEHAHGHDLHASDDAHAHPQHLGSGEPLDVDELDPANRSLAEALRISFVVLQIIMVALVAWFLLSGFFEVEEGQVGMRLHFGAVVGETNAQGELIPRTYEPGWHFAWPEPIDEKIIISTRVQKVNLDEAFWFQLRPGDETKTLEELGTPAGGLAPGQDGSLLTGDKNIVHGQWTIEYQILPRDAVAFARYVGLGEAPEPMGRAASLVRHAAEEGIVKVVAQTTADDFVAANVNRDAARRAMQAELDNMETGITVSQVLLSQPTPPLAVRDAFQAVSQAEAEQADQIEQARQEATKILSSTAGTAYTMLVDAVEQYERARAADDADAVAAADERIAELLRSDQVSGNVKPPIEEAINYRTAAKESVRGEVDRFEKLLPQYENNPRIIRNRLWQDVLQNLYASDDNERFYLPSDVTELWLDVNRDPEIRRRREQQRYQAEQQRAE